MRQEVLSRRRPTFALLHQSVSSDRLVSPSSGDLSAPWLNRGLLCSRLLKLRREPLAGGPVREDLKNKRRENNTMVQVRWERKMRLGQHITKFCDIHKFLTSQTNKFVKTIQKTRRNLRHHVIGWLARPLQLLGIAGINSWTKSMWLLWLQPLSNTSEQQLWHNSYCMQLKLICMVATAASQEGSQRWE